MQFVLRINHWCILYTCIFRIFYPLTKPLTLGVSLILFSSITLECSHVCRTKMMLFELVKRWDQYFSIQDNQLVQGICVLKSNPFTFWYFCPKIGQKVIKMGLKCLGLVWYGLVWLGCDLNWSYLKKLIPAACCSEFKSSSQIPRN